MKIIFDARYLRTDFHDGISRYSLELGLALAARRPLTFLICDKAQANLLPEGSETILFHSPTSWKEPFSALLLNRYHPDVVVSPMQTIGSLGRRFKLILTLHDLIYYRHGMPPQNLPLLIRIGWRIYHASYSFQRMALNAADMVMTVSQTSRAEILAARLTKRPILVATNAPQQLDELLHTPVDHTQTPTNLIYMGSFMPYKNVETLVKGMSELHGYTLHLLSRIKPDRRAELEELIPRSANVVFHDGVSDEEYAALLANRALLVTASLAEGFGIPVAESLALGVPAVISDLAIFHEVGGDGVRYFDPNEPLDFAKQVKEASKPLTYKHLGERGKVHIQRFSWQRSAEALDQALEQLATKPVEKYAS